MFRNVKRKTWAMVLSVILICSALSSFATYEFVKGQSSSSLPAQTLSAGPYPGAPSYTIFTDGAGGYYAKNSAGSISFTSTNAATVIMSAINALPTTGGVVQLSAGSFILTTSITVTTTCHWKLVGAGRGSYGDVLQGQTSLIKNFNGPVINVAYPTYNIQNQFYIESLSIYGQYGNWGGGSVGSYTGDGIDITNSRLFTIENVKIEDVAGNGVSITNSYVHRLQNDIIDNVALNGIYYNNTVDWQWYYVEVDSNQQTAGYAAVFINNSEGIINGGHFEGWRCLDVEGQSRVTVDSASIPWSEERAIYIGSGVYFQMDNTNVHGANQNGFAGSAGATVYLKTNSARITNCLISQSGTSTYSIYTESTAQFLQVSNSQLHLPAYFGATNTYLSNDIFGEGATLAAMDINMDNGQVAGTLSIADHNCTFTGVDLTQATVSISASGNSFSNCPGFITEQTGASSTTSWSWIQFPKSFPTTPTGITLGTNVPEVDAWWNSMNATAFQIVFSNSTTGATLGGSHTIDYNAYYNP